ncbi:lipopolysaccharide core heptose(I) kinase RfaP [Litorivivens sp.]|uniref:lipopolysaccharide core heptose(I) kinase RfaP n=1 Tax=Litorivivens sp. TaxID=2020868 RepID=UPI003568E3BF
MSNSGKPKAWLAPELGVAGDEFAFVESLDGDVYRAMPDRTTLRFERKGRGYFLKFHKGVGWKEIAKNLVALRPPILGADNELAAVELLGANGVDTMVAAGFGRRGRNPATRQSFLITQEIADAPSLEDVTANWGEVAPPPVVKRRLIKRIATQVGRMHALGVNHRDLYLCHFLLRGGDLERAELALIDLHRAQIRSSVPARWRCKDLAALYSSAAHITLTKRDYYRFLVDYYNKPLGEILRQKRHELLQIHKLGEKLRIKYLRKYQPVAPS